MPGEIGKAYLKVIPTTKGVQKALKKDLNGEAAGAGEEAGRRSGAGWVKGMAKVIAVAGVGKFIADSVSQGAALQQSLGGIETLYKDSADKMVEYANEAYKTTGLSANEYMETVTSYSAGLISSMGGDVDAAADVANMAMIDMADNANKMGTPMENIMNAYQGFAKQNYTMLDNLKLGYGGTRSEMERLLSDAEKISGVHYDINNLDDVYNAIHVIQTEIGITGTTQKEAAQTITGSIAMVKAAYKDFIGNLALGKDVTPQVQALIESIVTAAKNLIPAILNVVMSLPKALINLAPSIRDSIISWFSTIDTGAILAKFNEIGGKVGEFAGQLVSYIISHAPQILGAVLDIFNGILASLGQFITGFIGRFTTALVPGLKKVWAGIKTAAGAAFRGIWNAMKAPFVNIAGWFRQKFHDAWNAIKGVFSGVGAFFGGIWDTIRAKFTGLGEAVGSAINGAVTGAINGVISAVENIINKGIALINGALSLADKVVPGKHPGWHINELSLPRLASGGILTDATAFIGGEGKYNEAVLPLDPFYRHLDEKLEARGDDITINVYATPGMDVEELAEAVERRLIVTSKRRKAAWQ